MSEQTVKTEEGVFVSVERFNALVQAEKDASGLMKSHAALVAGLRRIRDDSTVNPQQLAASVLREDFSRVVAEMTNCEESR